MNRTGPLFIGSLSLLRRPPSMANADTTTALEDRVGPLMTMTGLCSSSKCRRSFSSRTRASLCDHRTIPPPSSTPQETLREAAPFNNIYTKPFPVRAAIEIGTGGLATIAVGRVDARQGSLKELLHQNQLPLDIMVEEDDYTGSSSSSPLPPPSNNTLPSKVVGPKYKNLPPETIRDVFDKVRQLLLSLQNVHNSVSVSGISEYAGLLTWPFYDCPKDQMRELAAALTREFKVDFRVLGMHEVGSDTISGSERIKAVLNKARGIKHTEEGQTGANGDSTNAEDAATLPPSELVEVLTFLGYATTAKVQDWDRLLVVVEDPLVVLEDGSTGQTAPPRPSEEEGGDAAKKGGHMYTGGAIHIIGTVDENQRLEDDDMERLHGEDGHQVGKSSAGGMGTGGATSTLSEKLRSLRMRRHTIPYETSDVHQMLLQNVQRRDPVNLHPFSSPNPVLRSEAELLRNALLESLDEDLPEWIKDKLADGALVVGASENGGLLNTAARITGRVQVGTERLEQATDYGICGLTDVLIGHTYASPCLVVPQAILCSALMRSLRVAHIEYIPQVSIAQALLVHPSFWTYNRKQAITDRLKSERWYTNLADRSYVTPHQARSPTNPNLAPQYNNSTKDGLGSPYYTSY